MVTVQAVGVFKEPVKYDYRYVAHIDIPAGLYGDGMNDPGFDDTDGSTIEFGYLGGGCGGGAAFMGPLIFPIIPFFRFNSCEKDGFDIQGKYYLDTLGVTVQLKYNNKIYEPYIVKNGHPKDRGDVHFKIENMKEFKNAPDKILIIKKGDFVKEVPFEWKVRVESDGGL